jgi:hypothetical protein
MNRLFRLTLYFALIAALFLGLAALALAQQSAPSAPAKPSPAASPASPAIASPAEATPTPGGGIAIQAIPELDESQSGTFLPDPDYVARFAQADPSLQKIEERKAETDFTTFDPVAALNMEINSRAKSIDSLRLQLQNESFYKMNPPLEPKRLQNVPVPPERHSF